MATLYEQVKKRLNEGYEIVKSENYSPKEPHKIVILWTILKEEGNGQRSIFCEVAFNVACMLVRDVGCKIRNLDRQNVCLNFFPETVESDHIRYSI